MAARGVILMTEQFGAAELLPVVERIEALGFESLWLPELFGREPFSLAGFLLARTTRINVATGIANVYARDAHAFAQARHTLAELSGGRFILGLGVSNAGANAARGHAWEAPLRKLTTLLDDMAKVNVMAPAAAQPAPLYIAAHGPKLQTLGATRTDGVITYMMPVEHTRRSRAHIGPACPLNAFAAFIAEADATTARTKARAALRMYIQLDYYHREWRKLGFTDADFANGGSDALVDALVAWGDADALNRRVAEYEAAGATRVIAVPLGLKSKAGLHPAVLEALAPRG